MDISEITGSRCSTVKGSIMNRKTISTTIEDSLGLKTGISINSVRVLYDREGNWIRITGRLAANSRTYTSFEYEPDLQADIVNSKNQICFSAASQHEGCFAASQKISFTIGIQDVSDMIPWDDIQEIHMYLIFRKRN